MPGRRRVLDEVKMAEICALLSVGCGRYEAAEHVGCAVNTIENTMRRDKAFAQRVRRAETKAEMTMLRQIRKAAKHSWRAGAWTLERTKPQRYARRRADYLTFDEVDQFVRLLAMTVLNEFPSGPFREGAVKKLDKLIEQFEGVASCETAAERRKRTKKISAENKVHKESAWERDVREAEEEERQKDEKLRSEIPNPQSETPDSPPQSLPE
jgi:hypothetical protein